MAFNKRKHLWDNIAAIRTAFEIEKSGQPASPGEHEILKKFSGFGALKCVLRPFEKDEDRNSWPESEKDLFGPTRDLYMTIRELSGSEEEYKRYADGIRSSILTAFYTPPEVVSALSDSLQKSGIKVSSFLDPSAGTGEFMEAFVKDGVTSTAFEIDPLTNKILKALHPVKQVIASGFETMPADYENHFDVVSSNIPFGDYHVFDPAFRQKDTARYSASRSIHNYFFVKAVDAAREGGIIAFITSQGVMDSPGNEDVRKYLMENCNLVSAIRLPNNLFAENAGTRVGSDLIILQKDTQKTELDARELAFTGTRNFRNGINVNNYYMDFRHIVHTEPKFGTDQYGQQAIEFYYDGNAAAIARDLSKKLDNDLGMFLNQNLYNRHQKEIEPEGLSQGQANTAEEQPYISIYDLFGIPNDERTQINEKQRKKVNTQGAKENDSVSFEELGNPMSTVIMTKDPRLYSGNVEEFYKKNTLVLDRGQIGYISYKQKPGENEKTVMFNPVDVPASQIARIRDYIPLRDAYMRLFTFELSYEKENEALRLTP